MSETTTQTYTAFALDGAGYAGPDPVTGDDPGYGPPGITVENAEGREVAGKDFQWPSGKFAADVADETLGRMGFRRISPWEWLSPQWVSAVATEDSTSEEVQ
jgi:hypothetical protein